MEKMVVVVFDNESKAYSGLNELRKLHQQADIVLYAIAVIAKDTDGKVDVRQADAGPLETLFGAALGSMVGMLAGPVGMAVGMASGSLGGAVSDISQMGIDLEFLDDVSRVLTPGKAAVVASIDEYWTTPLDTSMEPLAGTVFRKLRTEVIDDQLDREIRETQAELQALEEEFNAATAEQQAKLQAKIDATRSKLQSKVDAANKWMEETNRQFQDKVNVLQEQAKIASDRRKAQIQKQIAETQSDVAQRQEKLKQASTLAKEALTV
ncbi:DUF1269 domain-containing protein [Chlorogloeopsis sp. ULAP01]|uniref:DUF1269 domain-containing protein n=1 Tax=Chlorogloeopsis sp. ULAP01 TaxID=3056483 RepID=UPI0025AB3FC2|nr:DUF1269 domain-containing protein [Chlorogloeopsis sp. ULAP01]MDM9381201.1 DUF1269 domain-containing protein [Chlorogloeopsis sp. ULAP01]